MENVEWNVYWKRQQLNLKNASINRERKKELENER